MLRAINEATSKCSQQCETSSNSLSSEILILKEENKALMDKLKVVYGELRNMMNEIVLLKMALAHDGGAMSSIPIPTPSRMKVSKPKAYKGARNANEVDNFLWSL
ncbi:hypothetical protein V6N13_049333 [Hibiscus sabdariffa]|uniref:Uncharacterized protein n=1 Tax=Hibiscus sabdariffa TaxID=183260 RepID=A0ABR2QY50_9ROSI